MEFVALGFVVFGVLLAFGVPIFVAIGLTILVFLQSGIVGPTMFGESMFASMNSFPFIAIPLFILTGSAVVETGMSEKLLDLSLAFFGSLKTGIGTSVNVGSALFATISGSNAADAAAIGRITLDPLERVGYPRQYAAAMIASGSSTGILIPPSISYIIAGIALGVSVSQLFIAAFIPGFILMFGVIGGNMLLNRRRGFEIDRERESEDFEPGAAMTTLWEAKYALSIPTIILGGIYSGVFTATEAAIVAVTACFAIGLFTRSLYLKDYQDLLEESALVNGMIAPIIATALIFGEILLLNQIPQMIAETITVFVGSYTSMILVLLIVFLIAGATMELGPNILILGPLFLPLAQQYGMDPIHYTVFMMSVFAIGFITPPIGINLYVLAGISEEPVMDIAREAVPYAVIMTILVLIIGLVPSISLLFV